MDSLHKRSYRKLRKNNGITMRNNKMKTLNKTLHVGGGNCTGFKKLLYPSCWFRRKTHSHKTSLNDGGIKSTSMDVKTQQSDVVPPRKKVVDTLNQTCLQCETEVDKLNRICLECNNAKTKLHDETVALGSELSKCKRQIDDSVINAAVYQKENKMLKTENEELHKKTSIYEFHIREQAKKYEKLYEEFNIMQSNYESQERILLRYIKDIKALSDKNAKLTTQIQNAGLVSLV